MTDRAHSPIQLLVLDVEGVITDGSILLPPSHDAVPSVQVYGAAVSRRHGWPQHSGILSALIEADDDLTEETR